MHFLLLNNKKKKKKKEGSEVDRKVKKILCNGLEKEHDFLTILKNG